MGPIRSFIKNGLALHPDKFCKFEITGSEALYASLPLLIQPFKKRFARQLFLTAISKDFRVNIK
jgi:hypothetical protein